MLRVVLLYRRECRDMDKSVEISSIDLCYERCRVRSRASEKALLSSIAEQGIRDPLLAIVSDDKVVLLDGFKRLRCAKKLSIASVPIRALSNDAALGIIALMRLSNARSLTLLEQAAMIDELRRGHNMSPKDIALGLERSVSWVSMRQGILNTMSPLVREKIMNGDFPMYSYMYDLKRFMRMKIPDSDVENFVKATAAKGLSVRDISTLASGFFRGGDQLRTEILNGNVGMCLETLRREEKSAVDMSVEERRVVIDLEIAQSKMARLVGALKSKALKSPGFFAEARLLIEGIIRINSIFTNATREFYDRSRPPNSHSDASQEGTGNQSDCASPGARA